MAEAAAKTDYFVGVDLGGTKILAGVFDDKLNCLGRTKMSTKSERGAEEVIERIGRCARDVVDECDYDFKQVRAVGIGAPGAVDPETGRVIFAPNLQWQDVPLKKLIEKQLGVTVAVENDCNSATLGVFEKELQSKPRYMVGIFIGTGIGGGFIIDGKLYPGASGTAAEVGHMVIQVGGPKCNCGNRGCFEALASRTAIFRTINSAIKDGQKTLLTELLGPDLTDLRSGDLSKAIRKGDKLVDILNPQTVVLGGGVIDALGDEMMAIIVETAEDYILSGTNKGVEIVASKAGDDAGIIGGAVLARRAVK